MLRGPSGPAAGRRLRSWCSTWTWSFAGSRGVDGPAYLVVALAAEDDPLALIIDGIGRSVYGSKRALPLDALVACHHAGVGVDHGFRRGQDEAGAAVRNFHVRPDHHLALGLDIGAAV